MGFYNSLLDYAIDCVISNECENQNSLPDEVYSAFLYRFSDFEKCRKEIARDYVDAFKKLISDEFATSIDLEFESMDSPRFYNYETDKIFGYVDREKMRELFDLCTPLAFQATVDAHLKNRSGFIAFYSDFVNEWKTKPLEEWDCNELSMIFYCLLSEVDDYDLNLYYALTEDISVAFDACVNWSEVEKAVDEYLAENGVAL